MSQMPLRCSRLLWMRHILGLFPTASSEITLLQSAWYPVAMWPHHDDEPTHYHAVSDRPPAACARPAVCPPCGTPDGRKHVLWPCRRRNWCRLLSDAAQMARTNWRKLPSVGRTDRRSQLQYSAAAAAAMLAMMCYAEPDDDWSHAESSIATANAVGSSADR